MGYWEQTGVQNMEWNRRRALMPRWRRALPDVLFTLAGVAYLSLIAWVFWRMWVG